MTNNTAKEKSSSFIKGGFGLAITFWGFGIILPSLFTVVSSIYIANTTDINWLAYLSVFMAIYFTIISIAVWNAAKNYSGASFIEGLGYLAAIIFFANAAFKAYVGIKLLIL